MFFLLFYFQEFYAGLLCLYKHPLQVIPFYNRSLKIRFLRRDSEPPTVNVYAH